MTHTLTVQTPSAAIIDIGSNSIKLLVAARDGDGRLAALQMRTIDARISAGLSGENPRLGEAGMATGLAAIRELLIEATAFAPAQTILVATSAVRGAANGGEFRARVCDATRHDLRILSGDEEANLIGAGLMCDPALAELRDFYVFDLGGGSLECLAFRDRRIEREISLPLGCVRLTEKFVADPAAPFSSGARAAITAHTQAVLAQSGFVFELTGAPGIFAGGSMTTSRAIFAAREGKALEQTPALVTVAMLENLLDRITALPLAERQRVPGLPPRRADVFPAALTTILAVAEAAGLGGFQHSLYNLRWGLAAEALKTEATEPTTD